jgi:asparagine synthase (glutamine-hydrolysing)
LKKLAERYFPADFVHRPKMGFGIPLAEWLRGSLRKVLRETLLDAPLMAPLSGAVIERTLREFESGRDGHESRLWALLMFGCWRRQQGGASEPHHGDALCSRRHQPQARV